ncbi:MAG: chemotaxis protein CheB [Desulfocapsaceae bacterium]|nr:chemotaxis protein CheB [Desulfocapsaceae bacterium]
MRKKEAHQSAVCPILHKAVVMGGSAGGFKAFSTILSSISPDFRLPILIVQHLRPDDDGLFARHLAGTVTVPVIEPCDKQWIKAGHLYVAPANYHMLVEQNGTIALSVEEKVNWSRPSIDVLFESAALALGERIIAVILSGANADGAAGMLTIKKAGGLTIVQDPATAEYPVMPQAAIDSGAVDEVLSMEEIGRRLIELGSFNLDELHSVTL